MAALEHGLCQPQQFSSLQAVRSHRRRPVCQRKSVQSEQPVVSNEISQAIGCRRFLFAAHFKGPNDRLAP